MYNEKRSDGSRAIVTLAVLAFVGVAVWWMESRFGALVPILVIGGCVGVACFAGGAMLTSATQKHTMENLAKFNANDAQIDRYRMQSVYEAQKGNTAWQKAQAALTVLSEKRVDQLAQQRAGMLVDSQRQPVPQEEVDSRWFNAPQFKDDES